MGSDLAIAQCLQKQMGSTLASTQCPRESLPERVCDTLACMTFQFWQDYERGDDGGYPM